MDTTTLGPTDLTISRLGFGAMHLSLAGRPSEDAGLALVHRVLDLGVTFIDTADAYCINEEDKHHNERLLHKALTSYPGDTKEVVIGTKGGNLRPGPGQWVRNGKPKHLRQAIRKSFEILGGQEPIQLWQHHAPDPDVPVRQSLQAVKEAVDEGLVQHVGVSNYSLAEIKEARQVVDLVSVQNKYNPWYRKPEKSGVLEYCERENISLIAYSPLGGADRAKTLNEYEGIAELARQKNISPQRLVLAWLLHKSPAIVPIPGATRKASMKDSVQAVNVELSENEIQQINNVTAAVSQH